MKVKIWKFPDGRVSVSSFDFKKKRAGETDEDFIERISAKIKSVTPELAACEEIIADQKDLPATRGDRDAWRYDNASKKVKIDATVDTPKKLRDAEKVGIISKLKAATGLTDKELKRVVQD